MIVWLIVAAALGALAALLGRRLAVRPHGHQGDEGDAAGADEPLFFVHIKPDHSPAERKKPA